MPDEGNTMEYKFYGWETADIKDNNGLTPRNYYDILSKVWCTYTCAPRMRKDWSTDNKTLGQCSITAFLMQDIYGGKVYGVPLSDGNFHCFNDVGGCVFDLTSEQFGDTKLDYGNCPEQFREVHFAKEEKRQRYEYLRYKTLLTQKAGKYLSDETITRSVVNGGDTERLARLFERAGKGEKLTIAFLGGSITQGCLSSIPETCYAYLVYEWFVNTFPKSEFVYVNAGIGGTTSQFGAARLEDDVLAYRPDFCMVEFSVNDSDNVFFKETYESVVSRLLESETQPAVMILHNLFYETGRNAQKQHLAVGTAYSIPCVSVRDAIFPEIKAGKISIPQLSSDGLHPNDDGHAVLAELVTTRLESILRESEKAQKAGTEALSDGSRPGEDRGAEGSVHKPRITPDSYCTIKRFQNKDAGIMCRGFSPDNTPKENMLDIFKCGWKASKTGEEIEFTFSGTELGIQYRKTIRRPAPVAVAIIDGDEEHPVILDANFEEDWGDSLHIDTLLYHGHRVDPAKMYDDFETLRIDNGSDGIERRCMPSARHTVKIRIIETHEDDREVFYLVSFIAG